MDIKDNKSRLNDVCLIALQILDRLEYIHSKNVIHKDIKPFNFLLGKKDPNIIYIIDFGLSKNIEVQEQENTLNIIKREK